MSSIATQLGTRRHWMIWLAATPLLTWALVRTFGLDGTGVLAPLMSFTPWAAIAALFVFGLAAALQNWTAAMVAGASMLALSVAVLPRALGGSEEVPAGARTLTVLSANVYRGAADMRALVDLVRRIDPDLLAIQELRPGVARRLDAAGIRQVMPRSDLLLHARDVPGGRPGIGIYSDLPLRPIPREASTSMVAAVVTLADGEKLRVATVHPGHAQHQPRRQVGGEPRAPAFGRVRKTLAPSRRLQRDAGSIGASRGDRPRLPRLGSDNRRGPGDDLADEPLDTAACCDRPRVGRPAPRGRRLRTEELPGSDHRAIWATVFIAGS